MRFWIDDLRNPREYVQDWGKDVDIWSKSYEEFMIHLQIHVQGDQRIGHIYLIITLELEGQDWIVPCWSHLQSGNGLWMITQVGPLTPQIPMAGQKSLI